MYIYAIVGVTKRAISLGSLSMILLICSSFSNKFQRLIKNFVKMNAETISVEELMNYLDKKETLDFSKNVVPIAPYEIEFRDVSFRYPGSERMVLENFSIKIPVGQKLAIVGANGAGKTTFVKLLVGLYHPTEGEILINGINIGDINTEEYFKLFSVVFQEINILPFSLYENITCEDSSTKKDIHKIISDTNLNTVVDTLPKGIETSLKKILDETGVELSGGQNQKVAIARALYKNAPIMVLDEPTAALDPIAENEIYRCFDQIVAGKTSIYISHRLVSTIFCDRILVFEQGKVIEEGTHEDLMQKHGRYYQMYELQSRYYKES